MDRRSFIQKSTIAALSMEFSDTVNLSFLTEKLAEGKRIGIIGLDTTHSVAFTKALNATEASPSLRGYRVVAAYPYGSTDIALCAERIPLFTEEVKGLGVEIVNSIASLLTKVDKVLLETNDGRLHLGQARPVIAAGKTLFIDKPLASSLREAREIFEIARQHGVPVFSASSLRYADYIKQIVEDGIIGEVLGADTYSPAVLEATHPDLFWYGIHGVEMLFSVMGTGCKSVSSIFTPDTDVVIGTWENNRIGTFRGIRRGKDDFGGNVFGTSGIHAIGPYRGYKPLLERIVDFFDTAVPPVREVETLEILAFMEAADLSKERGGQVVSIEEVMGR